MNKHTSMNLSNRLLSKMETIHPNLISNDKEFQQYLLAKIDKYGLPYVINAIELWTINTEDKTEHLFKEFIRGL